MQLSLNILKQLTNTGRLTELNVCDIKPSAFQPRRDFSERELLALSKSIAGCGVLQPPLVRPAGNGFELICGERRVRAAELAGLALIPCIIVHLDDRQAAFAALTENLQRRDLNPFEQAEAYRDLLSRFRMTQSELAVALGVSQPAIANKLRLLALSPELQDKLTSANLTERHARALLTACESKREAFLSRAIREQLTAEQLEKLISDDIREEKRRRSYRRRAGAFSDVRLFISTIERAVEVMKLSGVAAEVEKCESGECIEYIIRVPRGEK